MACDTDDELEALTQFMYLAPVGLVQTSLDGEIASRSRAVLRKRRCTIRRLQPREHINE